MDINSAWELFKEAFNPFCWLGNGYCAPEADPEEKIEAMGSQLGRLSLDWKGVEFNPNLDNIFILTLAIIISSITSLIVAGWFFRREHPSRSCGPEPHSPQLGPVNILHPFSEHNDPDDKPPASASPEATNSTDMNNNAATPNAETRSAGSSILNPFREWFSNTKNSTNVNVIAPVEPISVALEPRLSIREVRKNAVIERVPSTAVPTTIVPSHLKFEKHNTGSVLVLHQIPRSSAGAGTLHQHIGSLKLETIIRYCGINHITLLDADLDNGPWISYCGVKYFGMEECLGFLNLHFPTVFQSCQVPNEKAVPARYIQILAERIHWALLSWRSVHHCNENDGSSYYDYMTSGLGEYEKLELMNFLQMCYRESNGIKVDQIISEIEKDLQALDASLGKKNFFIGDSMTVLDCYVFALLAQFMWEIMPINNQLTLKGLIQKYCGLTRYTSNIREQIWKDWQSQVLSPKLSPRESYIAIHHDDPDCVDCIYMTTDNSQFDRVSSELVIVNDKEYLMETICRMYTASQVSGVEQKPSYRSGTTKRTMISA